MIKKIAKIGILLLEKEREKILDFLQKEGSVEIIERREIEKEAAEEMINIRTKIAQVKFTLDFIGYFEKNNKNIREKVKDIFVPRKIYIKEAELENKVKNFKFEEIVSRCQDLEEKRNENKKLRSNLERKLKLYAEWKDLPYSLRDSEKLKNLKVFCGVVKDLKNLEIKIKENTKLYEIKVISNIEKKAKVVKFCLFYHSSKENEIKEILKSFEAKEVEELNKLVSVRIALVEIASKIEASLKDSEKIEAGIKKVSAHRENLEIIYDYLCWQERIKEVGFKLFKTERILSVVGWIEECKIRKLKKDLERLIKNVEIYKIELKNDEEPPVIIENKKFVRPVESVMDMYGSPKHNEIDPVPFMAPFFILFFGFSLSDAGYGLILTLLPLFFLKIFKIPLENRKAFYLLIYCGISTILLGIVFGSYFGVDVSTFEQGSIGDFLLKMRVADPMKNPISVLFIAIVLGVIQLISGLAIKMYWKIKNGMIKDAVLDELPWLYFIITILIFVAGKTGALGFSEGFFSNLIITGILGMILTQGRKNKNIFRKFFSGTFSLYGIISYVSDVLSYSRLLALSLSTSIIGLVVNLTAGIFNDMVPVIGGAISIMILIGGHIFNILTSSLGAFIHSMRLQFVEFFPKFMEGGGRRFKPFSRTSKYVEIINPSPQETRK